MFLPEHTDDIRHFEPLSLPEHLQDNSVAKLYRTNKYRVVLSNPAYTNLLQFLESKDKEGGSVMNAILSSFCSVKTLDRATDDRFSFAAMLNSIGAGQTFPAEDEGIPGHHPGSAYTGDNPAMAGTLPRLRLGKLPMEQTLEEDVRAELAEEDQKQGPPAGRNTLTQEFDDMIKKEEDDEAPSRADIPFPASTARDVHTEVKKVMEHRDRFEIKGRTGGVGPGVSVCMFTFHNTFDKYVLHGAILPITADTNHLAVSRAWMSPMTTCLSLRDSSSLTFVSGLLTAIIFPSRGLSLPTSLTPAPAV